MKCVAGCSTFRILVIKIITVVIFPLRNYRARENICTTSSESTVVFFFVTNSAFLPGELPINCTVRRTAPHLVDPDVEESNVGWAWEDGSQDGVASFFSDGKIIKTIHGNPMFMVGSDATSWIDG